MKFNSYEEMDREVMGLFNKGDILEAANVLESSMEEFPENLYAITLDMAVIYSMMTPAESEKIISVFEHGNDKGFWYNLNPEDKRWESIKDSSRFKELVKENNLRKEKAQAEAKAINEVYLPADFNRDKMYPLHIAIHGWGEDIPLFRKFWVSDALNKEYISLFVQSSMVATSEGYCWNDVEIARKEIAEAYKEIIKKYNIDMNNITVGGFSQGGTMSLDLILDEIIPAKGFISLCPNKPESFTKEKVESMKLRATKGIVLTGEFDGALPSQREMVEVFQDLGFPHKFIINNNLAHWFPENLSEQLDLALEYIGSEK